MSVPLRLDDWYAIEQQDITSILLSDGNWYDVADGSFRIVKYGFKMEKPDWTDRSRGQAPAFGFSEVAFRVVLKSGAGKANTVLSGPMSELKGVKFPDPGDPPKSLIDRS